MVRQMDVYVNSAQFTLLMLWMFKAVRAFRFSCRKLFHNMILTFYEICDDVPTFIDAMVQLYGWMGLQHLCSGDRLSIELGSTCHSPGNRRPGCDQRSVEHHPCGGKPSCSFGWYLLDRERRNLWKHSCAEDVKFKDYANGTLRSWWASFVTIYCLCDRIDRCDWFCACTYWWCCASSRGDWWFDGNWL